MIFVFGAIPFVDAMIVQYVDDRMRSRVSGMRLAVSFGVSSLAVYVLGPTVKAAGLHDAADGDGADLGVHHALRLDAAGPYPDGRARSGAGASVGHVESV